MNLSTFRTDCGDRCTETEFLESMSLCALFVGIKLKVSAVSPYLCVCSHWSARCSGSCAVSGPRVFTFGDVGADIYTKMYYLVP